MWRSGYSPLIMDPAMRISEPQATLEIYDSRLRPKPAVRSSRWCSLFRHNSWTRRCPQWGHSGVNALRHTSRSSGFSAIGPFFAISLTQPKRLLNPIPPRHGREITERSLSRARGNLHRYAHDLRLTSASTTNGTFGLVSRRVSSGRACAKHHWNREMSFRRRAPQNISRR